jgi:ribonuclease-3
VAAQGHTALEQSLGYHFREPGLLRQALTHRSFGAQHNERLEFIGDGLLNCFIALCLYEQFPHLAEGELSRVRANLVNRDRLHAPARSIALDDHLRLGEGELRTGGAQRPSILADTLEAVIGAVYLDGGFEAARGLVTRLYGDLVSDLDPQQLLKDPKTRLQEWLQGRHLPVPTYIVTRISGEAHNQVFEVTCRIESMAIAVSGSGTSRRAAEQAAAEAAYAEAMRS